MEDPSGTEAFASWWSAHGWAFDIATLGFIITATWISHKRNMGFIGHFSHQVGEIWKALASLQNQCSALADVCGKLQAQIDSLEKRLQDQ